MSRTASVPEQVSELEQFVTRIRLLGATDDEIAAVRDTWDDLDDEWTEADRTSLTLLDDERLLAELQATREEYQHDTTDEDQQEALDAAGHAAKIAAWAAEVVHKPVGEILDAVGDDQLKAMAVLDLELGPDGASRKTLVGPLQTLVAGDDPAGIPVEFVGERQVE